ncbi:alpha/beta hydrolase [Paenibacillus antibioticophila]|uniref:alpha/beta hydrolase n=1 Tax=Paenibacillus antibioticophila TaxID=1274374 RepID=UPI000AD497A5|nr:alpha/beta hydrolase [Paenibacillus antibioticophila]
MNNIVKKSAHLVDPDLKAHTDLLPDMILSPETLAQARQQIKQWIVPNPGNIPVNMTVEFIPGPVGAPDVRIIIFTPHNSPAPRPVYLQIHGGGMVTGTADMGNVANAALAAEMGCTVVSVDYRLAPENPHPAPIEDCYVALKWVHSHAQELGVDNERIAIGGESAGGGLAASLAVLARDRGEVKIIFQRLVIPMLDDRTCVGASHPYNGEYGWTIQNNYFGWKSLLGHEPGIDGVSPYASAPRATELSGLPPTFISIGAIELFLDECLDYAKRLIHAGVPTELHVYPGVHHLAYIAPDARFHQAHNKAMNDALRRAFYG